MGSSSVVIVASKSRVAPLKKLSRETFEEEHQQLKRNGTVESNSKLTSLDVFLNEEAIIGVGGRLQSSDLPERTKHPIVLPSKHAVVDLLKRRAHERQLHAGVEQTLATTRQQFWILRGRSSVKRRWANTDGQSANSQRRF
ncbi:hypothetical protein M513_12372 [Trichuris suis]|uniref:Uncharacterized protein n=1 Tax=Trichuris suis TaxID=68888 RepID=A0A085LP49_9BILA|nr:hypothetical protein M513_12372 [Trichuris suis]